MSTPIENCISPTYEFAEALNDFTRRRLKIQGKEMANLLGISTQYYSDLIRGRRSPSIRIADAVAMIEFKRLRYDHEQKYFIFKWHYLAAKAHGWRLFYESQLG